MVDYHLINEKSVASVILLAEHAGRAFPNGNMLGLNPALFEQERNLPYDTGVDGITRNLAHRLEATAVLGHYSRLWVDLNRALDAADLIPASAHDIAIPGNQNVSKEEREQRLQTAYWPFHNTIEAQIQRHLQAGIKPLLFSVHSFTPQVGLKQSTDPKAQAPQLGLLYLEEIAPVQIMRRVMQESGILTGDNFPYDLRKISTGGLHMHGLPHGLQVLGVEISIDYLNSSEDEAKWTALLHQGLSYTVRN